MPEPPDDSSPWRSSAAKDLETTLSVIRNDLSCEWLAIAMAQLVDGELQGSWLAHCGPFPRIRPLRVATLLERGPRFVGLEAADEEPTLQSQAWLLPLPVLEEPTTVRHTTVLVVSTRPPAHLPESIRALSTMISEYERRYLAEVLLTAIEQAPDPLELTDCHARLLYVNPAWRRYFDYTQQDAIGRLTGELVRDETNPVHDAAYVQFTFRQLNKRREWLGMMGSRTRDGARRFNEVHVSPFGDAALGHRGNLAVRRDLTHRDGRDAALAAAHREFRSVLAAMPDAVIVLREEVIYFTNLAFCDLVKRDLAEVIGDDLGKYVHPEDWSSFSQWQMGTMRSVRLMQPSGNVRIVEISMAGDVSFEGLPSHILLARDATERLMSREQLGRAERLAALGTMAADIAHEINNPLAYVILNLEAAREHGPPATRDAVHEALDGARRIAAIVGELRGLWNGSGETLGPVDVTTAVSSALNLTQSELRHRAHVVRQTEPGLFAFARYGQVVQVLMTLLSHAAEAVSNDDSESHTIRITSRSLSPTELEVTVSDTGVSPRAGARVFEPSAWVDATGVAPNFGLAISRRMIEELGGSLELSQTGPSGTTFAVRLPRMLEDEPAPESRNSHPELLQAPYRILVVDDEPLIARAIKRALGGFAVHVASDGAEALAVIEEGPEFDVILCDLMMPRLSGADLFALVRERFPHFTPRFVFMTGGAFADWGQHFLDAAHRPVIEKPFQPSQLRKCIESVAKKVRLTR